MEPAHQQPMDDNAANLAHGAGAPYVFYPPEEEPHYGNLVYNSDIPQYQVVQNNSHPREYPASDLQQAFQMRGLSLMGSNTPQYAGHQVYTQSSPHHAALPLSASPPPPSPNMYDPLSPPVSGSDTSADGIYHSRNSSGTGSPASSRGNSLVHRNPLRYNPTPSPSGSSGRRSRGRSFNDSDEDMGVSIAESIAHTRKEATRRQRIEAEQRRRDELRDGYARLKDVLPVSNQKSSKVSLLERATNHIVQLEKMNQQLQKRLAAVEQEVSRLRSLNEKISLAGGGTPSPGHSVMDSRPLSPPPEGSTPHALTSVSGQEPPREDSPLSSDGGY
ncbi:hypothetical protein EWM64_g1735 [Hericium alpestre]|uniref:BHLH domain-containing protein n=1 Tax=Hericium alpestre TaxID=135208 RepID=A0A4Z0A5H9_9AGAM|nr:hypothetical protein EWM64_g1735 [Hericium alpestre]